MNRFFLSILVFLALTACKHSHQTQPKQDNAWNDGTMWYSSGSQYDTSKIDVLYLVSTEVLSATDSLGSVVWQSQLGETDRAAMTGEMAWVENNMFYNDFNLLAPYYHQFTFDAISHLSKPQMDSVYQRVAKEACEAFDAYMEHTNHGRKFVLAGFSQGAMLTLDVLRHMTDEQFERMIACYCIGYRLSADDLRHPHIRAAQEESDHGVVVSFNSTQTQEAIWPFVAEGAATCINPINWRTDDTPAVFTFNSTTNQVHVDQASHVLIVTTDNPSFYYSFYELAPFFLQASVSRDNLHHWDLLFYASRIHDNAIKRCSRQ